MQEINLNYLEKGKGRTFIFIPGLLGSTAYFKSIVEKLSVDSKVIVFDPPGFGNSPKPDSFSYSSEDLAQVFKENIIRLNIKGRFTLVGYSTGALVASKTAGLMSEKVENLVLIAPPVFFTRNEAVASLNIHLFSYRHFARGRFSEFWRIIFYFIRPSLYFIAPLIAKDIPLEAARDIRKFTWKALTFTIKNVLEDQSVLSDFVKIIEIPIIIIHGGNDGLVIEKNLITLSEQFTNINLHRVVCKHQIPIECEEDVLECLRDL